MKIESTEAPPDPSGWTNEEQLLLLEGGWLGQWPLLTFLGGRLELGTSDEQLCQE